MFGEGAGEAVFFSKDGVLEFDDAGEFVFAEQFATDIYRTVVVVFLTPETGGVVVLQGESERIDLYMATGAIGTFPVDGEFFPDGQVSCVLVVFNQGRDVRGRRFRGIVEDN